MDNFFDQYPRFYKSSHTSPFPERLNRRYKAIIEWNQEWLNGARVLDIGSHDGRWTLAAIRGGGAKHVTGIEVREHLLQESHHAMVEYHVPPEQYEFVAKDAHDVIRTYYPGQFDVILCLGFLYHSHSPLSLLQHFVRLRPKLIVLDINTVQSNQAAFVMGFNNSNEEQDAFSEHGGRVIVLLPTIPAINTFFKHYKLEPEYYDWEKLGWQRCEDYRDKIRYTIRIPCDSKLG